MRNVQIVKFVQKFVLWVPFLLKMFERFQEFVSSAVLVSRSVRKMRNTMKIQDIYTINMNWKRDIPEGQSRNISCKENKIWRKYESYWKIGRASCRERV